MTLPVEDKPHTTIATALDIDLSGRKFLIVEDNIVISMDLEDFLRNAGAEAVSSFSDAQDAITAIKDGEFAFCFVDLHLGAHSSEGVLRRLQDKRARFAIMTGSVALDELEQAFPGVPVLAKPFATDDVAAILTASAV